jgi:2-keto-4-pentenoate hydratase/2-oxohepta-3-ene-1,7-dioic acid hydratase in catechol pathway
MAIDTLAGRAIRLQVNGDTRQLGSLDDLIWDVPDILHELSKLYALRAGDLVFMGTPAGVGPLQPGDRFDATLDGLPTLSGHILPPVA